MVAVIPTSGARRNLGCVDCPLGSTLRFLARTSTNETLQYFTRWRARNDKLPLSFIPLFISVVDIHGLVNGTYN